MNTTPDTLPFSLSTSLGPQPHWMVTSSSSASAISSREAGIFSRGSRQYMATESAPQRWAVRAASMATLPPPTTTHLPGTFRLSSARTWRKNSTAEYTPWAVSPGMPGRRPRWQPMAM